jgi:hypothetical protein
MIKLLKNDIRIWILTQCPTDPPVNALKAVETGGERHVDRNNPYERSSF